MLQGGLSGVSGPGGGLLPGGSGPGGWGSALRGVVCSWGVSAPGGVSGPGGSAPGRGGITACTEADPPVDRITDACKNITLAQLR